MPKGFIDHASISSALAALRLREAQGLSAWDRQCLTDSTYLLLFHDVGIVPGPSDFRGASGFVTHVVSALPSLNTRRFAKKRALRATRTWLTKKRREVRRAWLGIQNDPNYVNWAPLMRELYWIDHVRMQGALFDAELLPHVASILKSPLHELQRVHDLSQREAVVSGWLKTNLSDDEARLASDAYSLAILIRGRFHEYVATFSDLHLSAHPFRSLVQKRLRAAPAEPVSNSEDLFVQIIVGSALLETTEERRVKVWVENICKARNAIALGRVALPSALIESDAERIAADAARATGITTTYERVRRELDFAAALGIGGLALVAIDPWLGLIAPAVPQAYRQLRGVSIGDDFARTFLDTNRRFARLARRIPGRIERTVNLPPPK